MILNQAISQYMVRLLWCRCKVAPPAATLMGSTSQSSAESRTVRIRSLSVSCKYCQREKHLIRIIDFLAMWDTNFSCSYIKQRLSKNLKVVFSTTFIPFHRLVSCRPPWLSYLCCSHEKLNSRCLKPVEKHTLIFISSKNYWGFSFRFCILAKVGHAEWTDLVCWPRSWWCQTGSPRPCRACEGCEPMRWLVPLWLSRLVPAPRHLLGYCSLSRCTVKQNGNNFNITNYRRTFRCNSIYVKATPVKI